MTPRRTRPSVGVVIPCYNQAHFLATAVESVRAQVHWPVECLVVDDGSTDDTAAVASRLGVRLLRQSNAGVAAARNAGLRAIQSDLVIFLDADDELLPEAVDIEADALAANTWADGVVGRCQPIDADGVPLPSKSHEVDVANLYRQWLPSNFVWTPGAAMFRRTSLVAIGAFPVDLGPAADYAVYLRLARHNRMAFVPRVLVRYRQHEASMSRDRALMLRHTIGVLRREQRDAPEWAQEAIRDGMAAWRAWYGEQIIEDLRGDWNAGRVGPRQMLAALTLISHCSKLILRRTADKARRALVGKPA